MAQAREGASRQWSGEMLDRPEMMEAFAAQLRRVFNEHADFVATIRRDAEAMWRANPPDGYGSFEAWWRHRWVTSPFGEIQACLERAATLTFQLEARHRRGRHEIPAAKQAAIEAKRTPALPGPGPAQPRPARRPRPAVDDTDVDFLDLVHGRKERSA